ncbi:MAG: hypothetical protein KatS3mg023_0253 [Armatimonadota bacterium]|nr:MAG: hypothetical protein KatS3mg023_0253 [Armatimonadota bacterium]
MKRLAASILLGWGCLCMAYAQKEEKVTWSLQSTQVSLVPFHQFVGATEPADVLNAIARWAGWDEGENLVCESSHDQLCAVALQWKRTWTLALWNHLPQKVQVTIEGELPAGVYTTERLTLASGGEIVAVERRNGLLQSGRSKRVQRIEWLPANTGLVLRFVERTQRIDQTLFALRKSIWQSRAPAGVLSRCTSLLREADSHWHQVRASLRKGNVRMGARGVHRMLFLTSGIRAVASQYAVLKEVTGEAEALIDSLSELSSALLNVVVEVSQSEQAVRVKVVNAGHEVWKALRLALEPSSEADTVVLANIRPMERAEVSFQPSKEQTMPVVVVSVLFHNGYTRLKVSCGSMDSDAQKEAEP